ncbi:MAG: riboflavin synthase, partial [Candidatus Goldbacteria bacterium]|nr:riboflavin synthase [Candidatus Goldiibacteriota bacterium]
KEIKNIHRGMSIAVNGVCLTVVSFNGLRIFSVDITEETIKKTTFNNIGYGKNVNIELPVTPESFLSGHIVQGHIDAIGVINSLKKETGNTILKIEFPEKFSKYLVEKGSIAVDGVSLTAFDVKKNVFKVSIIPETLNVTIIGEYKKDDKVNLEFDIIGKYVENMLLFNVGK